MVVYPDVVLVALKQNEVSERGRKQRQGLGQGDPLCRTCSLLFSLLPFSLVTDAVSPTGTGTEGAGSGLLDELDFSRLWMFFSSAASFCCHLVVFLTTVTIHMTNVNELEGYAFDEVHCESSGCLLLDHLQRLHPPILWPCDSMVSVVSLSFLFASVFRSGFFLSTKS